MWQRYQQESCHLLAPAFSGVRVNRAASARWLSSSLPPHHPPYLLWSEITNRAEAMLSQAPVIYRQCCRTHAGWQNSPSERPPRNNKIRRCNIEVVEKAVFQWCYLSCSVPSPCNDDLSLFSVLCSIFIYDQASFFHCISLALSSIFFVPYLQLMKKIKKRNILCALLKFTRQEYNDREQDVPYYVLNALTQILLFPCLVSTWHFCPYSFFKEKAKLFPQWPAVSHSKGSQQKLLCCANCSFDSTSQFVVLL